MAGRSYAPDGPVVALLVVGAVSHKLHHVVDVGVQSAAGENAALVVAPGRGVDVDGQRAGLGQRLQDGGVLVRGQVDPGGEHGHGRRGVELAGEVGAMVGEVRIGPWKGGQEGSDAYRSETESAVEVER